MLRQSISVLRAFEALGRHLSFSRAADELNLSQSAVSRHVATLERDLDCRLVTRTTRHCALTEAGERLHAGIASGLREIESALRAVQREGAADRLRISVSPFLSVAWFTPRLLDFIALNPDIEVTLAHSYEPPRFEGEEVDVGLNWGRRPADPQILSVLAVSGSLVPACTPAYARRHIDRDDSASLLRCELFHEFRSSDWQQWFALNGVDGGSARSQQISDTGALRRTALAGKGVALLFEALIGDDLRQGNLVCPFPRSVNGGEDYWLTYPRAYADRRAVRQFLQWFEAQLAQGSSGR